MEKQTNLREINLGDVWRIFIARLWVIVLAVIIVLGGFITFTKLTYKPRYEATATLYILRQYDSASQQQESEDFSLALNVVNDCDHMLKSHAVLDSVIKNLGLDISYNDLNDSVSTTNPEDTRILQVTVEADSAEEAEIIVNAVCEVGQKKINEAMRIDQVGAFEPGIPDYDPCNKTSLITYGLVGLIVAVVVYSIFLLSFLFDDRLKTDEEIERNLELTVIGDIPNADEHKNHKYGYYRYYGKKGYKAYGSYGAYGTYGAYGAYGAYKAEDNDASDNQEKNKMNSKKGKKAKNKKAEENK